MKKLFALIALVLIALAFVSTTQAQTYGTVRLIAVTTLAGSAATNATSGLAIDIRQNRNGFALTFAGDAAGTANVTAAFVPSIDGTTYEDTKVFVLTGPANGAGNAQCVTTNMDLGAYGYIKLAWITNAAASGNITNVSVTASLKPGQ